MYGLRINLTINFTDSVLASHHKSETNNISTAVNAVECMVYGKQKRNEH
jgi:hypothetical protein